MYAEDRNPPHIHCSYYRGGTITIPLVPQPVFIEQERPTARGTQQKVEAQGSLLSHLSVHIRCILFSAVCTENKTTIYTTWNVTNILKSVCDAQEDYNQFLHI